MHFIQEYGFVCVCVYNKVYTYECSHIIFGTNICQLDIDLFLFYKTKSFISISLFAFVMA